MQTTPISRLVPALLATLLVACAGGAVKPGTNDDAGASPDPGLSLPDHALDMLPLEHLLSAEFALREDNLDAAARSYLQAARDSDNVEVARRATRVNLAAQNWSGAGEALSRWQALADAATPDVEQAQAALALGRGDADGATAILLGLLRTGGIASVRVAAGALEAAPDRALSLAVLERVADSPELPDDAGTLIGLSQTALALERMDLAEALAERGTSRAPDSSEAWFWRARLANAGGDTGQAREVLDQAVQLNPENPDIRRTYAVLLKNEFGDAGAAAQALAGLPDDDDTLALRGTYAMEAGDWDQVEAVRQALAGLPGPHPPQRAMLVGGLSEALAEWHEQTHPEQTALIGEQRAEARRWYEQVDADSIDDHVRAQQRLAVLDQQDDRIDDMRARLEDLRDRVDPDQEGFAESYLLESELLERAQRRGEALEVLSRGLAALPDEPRLRYSRGLAHERLDQVEAALADFRTLVESDPDNPVFLNAYGYTLTDRTDRHEEALVLIERALEINPADIATTDSMGWVLFKLDRHDEALHYLRIAFDGQPDGEIGAHLGEVLWVSGERDEARQVWRQALDGDPDNRVLQATIERFRPW